MKLLITLGFFTACAVVLFGIVLYENIREAKRQRGESRDKWLRQMREYLAAKHMHNVDALRRAYHPVRADQIRTEIIDVDKEEVCLN